MGTMNDRAVGIAFHEAKVLVVRPHKNGSASSSPVRMFGARIRQL
jgi:hypothetical protein